MRRVFASLGVTAALLGGIVVGADLSSAGEVAGRMQAVPPTSTAPATVTVSNVDDTASKCEAPNGHDGVFDADPLVNGGVQVSLNLTSTNGTTQMNTVTPDAMGDWSQTYNNLPVGTYTVNGECELADHPEGTDTGTPQQIGPFVYEKIQFVVTAPAEAPAEPAAAAPVPIAASPAFTG